MTRSSQRKEDDEEVRVQLADRGASSSPSGLHVRPMVRGKGQHGTGGGLYVQGGRIWLLHLLAKCRQGECAFLLSSDPRQATAILNRVSGISSIEVAAKWAKLYSQEQIRNNKTRSFFEESFPCNNALLSKAKELLLRVDPQQWCHR